MFIERLAFEKSTEMYIARFVVAVFLSVLMLMFLPHPFWMAYVTGIYARLLMVLFISAQFSWVMPTFKKIIDRIM